MDLNPGRAPEGTAFAATPVANCQGENAYSQDRGTPASLRLVIITSCTCVRVGFVSHLNKAEASFHCHVFGFALDRSVFNSIG